MSKKSEFLAWCKERVFVSSVMARDYGYTHFFLRAERALREFGEAGLCERLNLAQKLSLGLMQPEQVEIAWCRFD